MLSKIKELAAVIAPILARYPAIEAGYLFGSHARGEARHDSDLDLALVGDPSKLQDLKLDVLTDLTAAGFDRIDLVCLDDTDIILSFEAVSPNCPIYLRDGFDHGSDFSRTLREYFDFEPYLRAQREALKARALSG
jgi:predicted nucleotidyltransferase